MHQVLECTDNVFSVITLNIQSLKAKFDNLVALLDILNSDKIKIDALCLQETWIDNNCDLSTFQIPNYYCISQSRFCSSHGGLIIYLSKKYNFTLMDLSHQSDICESLFIDIKIPVNNFHIILGNIYKPPKDNNNNANIEAFITELSPKILHLHKTKSDVILVGDFNINLLQIKTRPIYSEFFNLLTTNNFHPCITYPTRLTDNSGSLIDNIFLRSKTNHSFRSSGIILSDISDHLPCYTLINRNIHLQCNRNISFSRSFSEENLRKIFNYIRSKNMYELLDKSNTADPDKNYNILYSVISTSLNLYAPKQRIKFNKYKHKKSPWITNGIIKSIKVRDQLYKSLKCTDYESLEFTVKKHNLRVYKAILNRCIRSAKRTYYYKEFTTFKSDSSKTWKLIKDVI